ncbi:hypothetical protein E2C01_034661 [Portunus trituberculatus]|uniref:Uncharacterized protein n=1 Tax=Portunus trituberculatus TaxID=210409 RepID=A0A5B7F158_PORTR|nr:hypothetical protein [Portunus trituberculatus]
MAVRQCEGCTEVVESKMDGRPCPLVVDTGVAKTFIKEEVVAAQDLPVWHDWPLYDAMRSRDVYDHGGWR